MSSDVGLNQADLKKATLKSCHSHENDSLAYSKDNFEKFKEEYCWEFQKGKLKYFNKDNPDNSTTTTVVKIERRRGTKMLILRCGPKGRLVFFLEFDSKKLTDEWQEAICQFTGQEYDPSLVLRRVQSDLHKALRAKYRANRSKSAFPDIDDEQMPDDTHSEQGEPLSETSPDASDESPAASPSPPETIETVSAPSSPSDELLVVPSYSSHGSGSVETDDSDDGTQNAKFRANRSKSAFPDIDDEQMPDDTHSEQDEPSSDTSPDSSDESPVASSSPPETMATMVAPPSPSDELLVVPSYSSHGSGSVETDDSDDGTQNASRPSSLRSRDGDISPSLLDLPNKSVEREFEVSDLQKLVLRDCNGNVV
nr:cell surface glycoprotein 1-like [Lytechinus pictus]